MRRLSDPFVLVHPQTIVSDSAAFDKKNALNILIGVAHLRENQISGVAKGKTTERLDDPLEVLRVNKGIIVNEALLVLDGDILQRFTLLQPLHPLSSPS